MFATTTRFPITIFFGGLFCFLLPCWYCGCGPAAFRTVKKAFKTGAPALDEEEGPRVPKGGFQVPSSSLSMFFLAPHLALYLIPI